MKPLLIPALAAGASSLSAQESPRARLLVQDSSSQRSRGSGVSRRNQERSMRTKQKLTVAANRAVVRARIAGKRAAKQLIAAADEALVAQGKAARARQRKRAFKAALKKVGKTLAIAGTAAVTVMAVRAGARRSSASPE